MGRLLSLTREEALAGVALAALATLACLSPVHNDTWWHLAYGRHMAEAGGFAQTDPFSFTAAGQPFPNHQWLSERVFYAVHSIGGLPLLTALCASLLTSGWLLVWRLTRGTLADRLLVTAGAVAASTLVWSIRPQVFTVALLPLVVTLLARDRVRWVPAVVLLWSNLHGGVLLGLLAIGVWAAVAAVCDRRALPPRLGCLAASAAATCVTPMGLQYWPEIARSLQRSQVNRLQEWQAPAWPPQHPFFWMAAVALVVLVATRWRRLDSAASRGLAGTALLLLLPAIRTQRNVAPFMMLAAPALTHLLATRRPSAADARRTAANGVVLAGAVACAALLVSDAWRMPWPRLQWTPIPAAAAAAIGACPGPLYNAYGDGGPIIWFVPGQRVFLDSRQDQFPPGLVQEATAIENGADSGALFARYGIRCAALPASSPTMAARLAEGWRVTYRDRSWVVAVRP